MIKQYQAEGEKLSVVLTAYESSTCFHYISLSPILVYLLICSSPIPWPFLYKLFELEDH